MTHRLFIILCGLGFLAFAFFTYFSFSLTAPNLILSNWQPYWHFQLSMWETYFNNRNALTWLYIASSLVIFSWYFLVPLLHRFRSLFGVGLLAAVVAMPLFFSSTALSYDVFNYIFNAKMVMVYNADPHVQVAQDFTQDDWLRFMHNVHTPAPYGIGWTTLSLLPFFFGFTIVDSFLATWLSFRLFMIAGLVGFFGTVSYLAYRVKTSSKLTSHSDSLVSKSLLFVFLCHPLVLIETISSQHNDIWMMWPAVLSLLLVSPLVLYSFKSEKQKKASIYTLVLLTMFSAILLLASMQVKLATVVLVPLWAYLVTHAGLIYLLPTWPDKILCKPFSKLHQCILKHWAVLASIALFVPLLTERSKWFLPWYIIWSLIWIPFFPRHSIFSEVWFSWIVAISVSVFFRYIPFLLTGNYNDPVTSQQLMITWVGAALLTPVMYFWQSRWKKATKQATRK
jgi:hypothetical protein